MSNQQEAECFAGRVVDKIGESRLLELGVTDSLGGEVGEINFSDSEFRTIVTELSECVDLAGFLAEEFEDDFGEKGARCVADNLEGDVVIALMRAGLEDPDAEPSNEFLQVFLDVAAECDLPLG